MKRATLDLVSALEIMRRGELLFLRHNRPGVRAPAEWFLAGKRLDRRIAHRLIAHAAVKAADAGLFTADVAPAQSYRHVGS